LSHQKQKEKKKDRKKGNSAKDKLRKGWWETLKILLGAYFIGHSITFTVSDQILGRL
jgi:hypothetical protein